MREWRAKQKAKSDEIESQLKQQTKKVTQQPRIKKRINILDDNFGREVETGLESQYPKQEESYGVNAWGSSDSSEKPKPKSNQDKLKDILANGQNSKNRNRLNSL